MGRMKEIFGIEHTRNEERLARNARIERIIRKDRWRKRRRQEMSNDASEEMKRRIANGEFGNPRKPDMQAINDAWADILEAKMKEVGKD